MQELCTGMFGGPPQCLTEGVSRHGCPFGPERGEGPVRWWVQGCDCAPALVLQGRSGCCHVWVACPLADCLPLLWAVLGGGRQPEHVLPAVCNSKLPSTVPPLAPLPCPDPNAPCGTVGRAKQGDSPWYPQPRCTVWHVLSGMGLSPHQFKRQPDWRLAVHVCQVPLPAAQIHLLRQQQPTAQIVG
jgi:hypothetical protein